MKRSLSPQAPRLSPSHWTVRNLKPNGTVPKKGASSEHLGGQCPAYGSENIKEERGM